MFIESLNSRKFDINLYSIIILCTFMYNKDRQTTFGENHITNKVLTKLCLD